MIRFANAIRAWGSPAFEATLKGEIEQLGTQHLPLQQGLSGSSYALDTQLKAIILSTADKGDRLQVKAGIFYSGVIAGCSCADDPTPIEEQNEYCEMWFDIDKITGEATVALLPSSL